MHGYPGVRTPNVWPQWNARFLIVVMEDWPNYLYMINHYGANEEAHKNDIWANYFVPLSYSSGVLTADFWGRRYGALGLRALMIPKVLRQDRGFTKGSWTAPMICSRRTYVGQDIESELDQFRAVSETWKTSWAQLRPW